MWRPCSPIRACRRACSRSIEAALSPFRRDGTLPLFPHGTEMTAVEQSLVTPLADLQSLDTRSLFDIGKRAWGSASVCERAALTRLALDRPQSLKDRLLARLVLGGLRRTEARGF